MGEVSTAHAASTLVGMHILQPSQRNSQLTRLVAPSSSGSGQMQAGSAREEPQERIMRYLIKTQSKEIVMLQLLQGTPKLVQRWIFSMLYNRIRTGLQLMGRHNSVTIADEGDVLTVNDTLLMASIAEVTHLGCGISSHEKMQGLINKADLIAKKLTAARARTQVDQEFDNIRLWVRMLDEATANEPSLERFIDDCKEIDGHSTEGLADFLVESYTNIELYIKRACQKYR